MIELVSAESCDMTELSSLSLEISVELGLVSCKPRVG